MRPILISLLAATLRLAAADPITTNVVVKDRKGAALKGIAADQFSLTDNGAKVSGLSVRMVDAAESPKLITIVFEQMDNEQRRLAKMIANDLVRESREAGHQFAVFIIANQLCLLQPFTKDRELLRQAIDTATSGEANTRFAEVHQQSLNRLRGAADELSRLQLRMTTTQTFAGAEGPRRAISFLDTLSSGLASSPGRKAIAYLAPGLFVPAFMDVPFQALHARANRSGVSFYSIDCRGVQINSQNRAVDEASASGAGTPGGLENLGTVNFQGLERIQDNLRLNLQANLRVLAESTGGLLIADTNDPKPFLRQLLDDSASYYELTYDPQITDFNGAYRKTAVTVTAKDARVRDRDGYLALRADQQDLLPYELPMIAALARTPLPREIEFRSGAIRLQPRADSVAAAVLVEVPFAGVVFKQDAATAQYLARISMLVQIKDAAGKVVQRYSRDLPLKGKLEQLPALQASNFSFREQFSGPPGRYTIDAIVADQLSGKVAARRTAFLAAAKPTGVAVSSISIVRSFLPNAKDLNPEEPFQFQGGRITPTFLNTLKQLKGAQMAFFFTVYPDAAATGNPQATVQYLKDGAVVGNATLPLPARDSQGRIPYVLSSPIESMPPGSYEVKITVQHGATAAQESAFFTIEG